MRTGWFLAVLFALVPAGLGQGQECPARTLDAGPLKLEVHVSGRTATLFHVVDQVSGWSEFCHRQYAEDFESRDGGLSSRDRELLARHATVRQTHGWGAGLEQTFYTPSDLDTALKNGVAAGSLTAAEAAVEREVLLHFSARIDALRERQAGVVKTFAERLVAERANLQEFAQKVSRFCGGGTVTVPVFLLANPSEHNCGGGFNGGRLTWEVPGRRDVYLGFLHEVFHAFLEPHRAQFDEAARRAQGLDSMTLNEGMAYAMSPGLLHREGDGDPLLSEVRRDIERKSSLANNYARFHRLGLALRPLLREALDDKQQTLTTFLPRAADAWRVAVELDRTNGAAAGGDKLSDGSWFSAGPAWQELFQLAKSRGHSLYSFNHRAEHYQQILSRSRPGSMVVLMFALDHQDKNVPEQYQDMLPVPWSRIEAALQRGETLEVVGKARERRIVLLAAPTQSQLVELINKTKLLSPTVATAAPKAEKPEAFPAKTSEKAAADGNRPAEGNWFSAGPAWRELTELAASRGHNLASFNHSAEHYGLILSKSQPGSMVVLLFALDHPDKDVPKAYQDMLPMPWSQIEASLQRGETLEAVRKARERRIVLLAAPTQPQLVALIQKTKLLSPDAAPAPAEEGKGQPIAEVPVPSCDQIDYSHPDRYAALIPHLGNKEHILKVAATIDGKTPEEKLVAIGRWIHSHLVYKADAPYEWRDFDRLLSDGNYGGCADYSVVFGSLARGCGVSTVWVKTLDCDWIREFRKHGTEGTWSGHVFLEVFVRNRWVLLDDTELVLYEDYDPKMRILPGNRYAYAKGGDPFDLILSSRWELCKAQIRATFRDFDLSKLPDGAGRALVGGTKLAASGVPSAPSKYPAVFVFYSAETAPPARMLAKVLASRLTRHLTGRYHSLTDYQEQFTKRAKPGDTIVLCLLTNEKDLVPAEFQDLLPKSWPKLVAEAARKGAVKHEGESRRMHVVLLLAKTPADLTSLVQKTQW